MITQETVESRRIIESLRMGVPNRNAVRKLGVQNSKAFDLFCRKLEGSADGQCGWLLLEGSFGRGKSHTLLAMSEEALARGYSVSRVVVGPDAPLGSTKIFLKTLGSNIVHGDFPDNGLVRLLGATAGKGVMASLVDQWPFESELLKCTCMALRNRYDDEEVRLQLLQMLMQGQKGDVGKRLLAEWANLPSITAKYVVDEVFLRESLQVQCSLLERCGSKGLVLFIDELERLERFSRPQRAQSYEMISWLRHLAKSGKCHVVLATVEGLNERVERDRRDLEGQVSKSVKDGMALLDKNEKLLDPGVEARRKVCAAVREIYGAAYECEPRTVEEDELGTGVMRKSIRRWILDWDLQRHYPGAKRSLEEKDLEFSGEELEELPDLHEDGSSNVAEGPGGV